MDINGAITLLRSGAPEKMECRTQADVLWENQRLERVRRLEEIRRLEELRRAPEPGRGLDGYPLQQGKH